MTPLAMSPTAIVLPVGEKAKCSICSNSGPKRWSESRVMSQNAIFWLLPLLAGSKSRPLAKSELSGDHAKAVPQKDFPGKVAFSVPPVTSHSLTTSEVPAEASHLLFGENDSPTTLRY